MEIDYIKLAELKPGERPYKGYHIPLDKGYVRIMASKIDGEGMVTAINYYGRTGDSGKMQELTRVTDKRQSPDEFEADLGSFRDMLVKSGMTIFVEDLTGA